MNLQFKSCKMLIIFDTYCKINFLLEQKLISSSPNSKIMLHTRFRNSKDHLSVFLLTALAIIFQFGASQQTSNLLINGDLSRTNLSGRMYYYYPGSVTGWNCTSKCEIDDCALLNQYYALQGSYNANCTGLAIDLISDAPENITQVVSLSSETYLLSLNYYYPRVNANLKSLRIYFNQELIFNFTPNISFLYLPQYFQKQVQGVAGQNLLRLTTVRNSGFDVFGFSVNNISLVGLYDSLQELLNNTIIGNFSQLLVRIPASKVILGDLMGYFINFDRLQLYYLHNRNYSEFSSSLLADINVLNNLKGTLLQNFYELFGDDVSKNIQNYFNSKDYKYKYSSITTLKVNSNGGGFVSNCYVFFVYNMPGAFIVYLVFYLLFRITKNKPASRLIRKFSFIGLLVPCFLDGNIENLNYYSIGQFKLFFSANLNHKLINFLIICFQYCLAIISVGIILWFKFHYGRKICYFLQNRTICELGVLCQIIDNGVICLLFGAVHQLMLQTPNNQLAVLFIIQSLWMCLKVYFIFQNVYRKRIPEFIMLTTGLARLCFILTFYFYQKEVEMRNLINKSVHKGLVYITLILWLQQFIASFINIIIFYYNFAKKLELFHCFQSQKADIMGEIILSEKAAKKIQAINQSNQLPKKSIKSMKRTPIIRHTNEISQFRRNQVKIIQQRIARIMGLQMNHSSAL